VITSTGIDLVQLHGEETMAMCDAINAPCIKVMHLKPLDGNTHEENNVEQLQRDIDDWSEHAIAVLLDSRIPGQKGSGTIKIRLFLLTCDCIRRRNWKRVRLVHRIKA
jgi:phosphoribosylanthranilate isomerase